MKPRVQILMSTYNGEKFLKEQLDSILNQKGNFELGILVRDDGSNDETIKILKEYSEKSVLKIEILKGNNIGVNASLKELFLKCDIEYYDYFALSDQDDVWLDTKIQTALNKLQKEKFEGLKMFASRSFVTDEKLNIIGKTQDSEKKELYYNATVQNICPGHTQVFNKEVVKELRENYSENIFVIDWWIYLLVSGTGKVIFERECTVKHRQHGINTAGYELNFLKKTKKRMKFLNKYKKSPVSLQLESFLYLYAEKMKEDYKKETEKFLKSQKNIFKRVRYISKAKVFRYGKIENLIFKILYILGKYK